jgi:hypothetical protein
MEHAGLRSSCTVAYHCPKVQWALCNTSSNSPTIHHEVITQFQNVRVFNIGETNQLPFSKISHDGIHMVRHKSLLNFNIINSKEQSPSWEADSHSASQEISRLLWNPKVHYRVHNSPPLLPILSQLHAVHTFLLYFSNIHFNIIFSYTPRSSKWYLPFGFPD